jgi:large subunit ribosomal protein L5
MSTATAPERQMPRLKRRYLDEVHPALLQQFGFANPMQVPRLSKIVVNMGVGDAVADARAMEGAVRDLATVTGQKPRVNRARKSVAGFKLRAGMAIGAKVTLRGDRMWDFFDRLLAVALPRIRDFRGLPPRSWDGHGNYTFGVSEQLIFPEVDYDSIDKVRGMDITIVTTAETDEHGRGLLAAYGFPFADNTPGAGA